MLILRAGHHAEAYVNKQKILDPITEEMLRKTAGGRKGRTLTLFGDFPTNDMVLAKGKAGASSLDSNVPGRALHQRVGRHRRTRRDTPTSGGVSE